MSEIELRYGRIAEVWASVSIGLIMIAFVVLIFFAPQRIGFGMAILISAMIFSGSGLS